MKPGLRGVLARTVELLRADERVVAAYNTGSVGTEREDDYSDVDPMFVVRAAEFEGLDRDLKGVFAAAGVTPILWWPERGNCDTLRNYAIMFEHEGELLQYDINIQAWESGPIPVRPGSVLPLHINAAQQVIVRIGDKAVARAELVEIEGEIGARIVAML